MAKRIQQYESDTIEVTFDPNLCIHAARCLQALPDVFDVRRRRWIAPEAGSADDIAATVQRCPSGALRYHRLDGGEDEAAPEQPFALAVPDGPVYVRGDITIQDAVGGVFGIGTRYALCRCGGSANKPFCDNSHRENGFHAP